MRKVDTAGFLPDFFIGAVHSEQAGERHDTRRWMSYERITKRTPMTKREGEKKHNFTDSWES